MKYKRLIALLMLIFISTICVADKKRKKEEVSGTVVAYIVIDVFALILSTSDIGMHQTILVRIDECHEGKRTSRYIKVFYKYIYGEVLPDEVFDAKRQWRFSLLRDESCDSSMEEFQQIKVNTEIGKPPANGFRLVSGISNREFPLEAKLSCYILESGDFKPAK